MEPVAEVRRPDVSPSISVATLKRTLSLIARPHETLHRSGDSAPSRRRIGVFETLSRFLDFAETLGFEPFELVVKLGARCELYSVARRRQWFDDQTPVGRFWRRGGGRTTVSGRSTFGADTRNVRLPRKNVLFAESSPLTEGF